MGTEAKLAIACLESREMNDCWLPFSTEEQPGSQPGNVPPTVGVSPTLVNTIKTILQGHAQ